MPISVDRLAAVLAVVLLSTATPVALQDESEIVLLDEVVARVNDEIITLVDLQNELRLLRGGLSRGNDDPEAIEQEYQRQRGGLLRTMIQNKMLLQRAEEFGMTEGVERQVSETLEKMREESGIPTMEVLDQYLRQQGSSLAEYRSSLRERIIIDTLLQQFVYSRLTLLTPEIEAYYQENADRYTEPAEVELKEILLLSEGQDRRQVRQRAQEVLQKLEAGESFEDLARRYSEGPTASQGGGIGTFKMGSMAAPIEEAALRLEPGRTSGILEADYGMVIIQVVDRKEPRTRPLEEVRSEISRELYQQKAQPGLREFMEEVREQSYVHVTPKYAEEYDLEGL